ncbi:alpha-1,4-glucan--maltose-1-phosphate maltosyltransferase [Nocardioides sp. TRM66260-LWL]|uniref:alpha-1,4-glucan--maltose-1-phosphate maltosyltransferase n=1 Tax=Nocardioides sp. TRM66260-LWL TaxID=2874478 RepID=UPI001CC7297E|nr:maltotransferase domain-containing protein [Nocardioides sp. TRM66260-LWL]MBZ5735908.1 alpha-1,4-glucan--maltose-1-phosphate maltosyltransferase [Nocardioides sp. TRM66260-LWL]
MVGRIPVMDVMPLVDPGASAQVGAPGRQASPLRPAKATVGEPLPITATVFREGHDRLGAEAVLVAPDGTRRPPVRMTPVPDVPDLLRAWVVPDVEGAWSFEVHAWSDPLATWQHAAGVKIPAAIDVELMFAEGALLLQRVRDALPVSAPDAAGARALLDAGIKACGDRRRPPAARLAVLEDDAMTRVLREHPLRELLTVEGPFPLFADRPRALFGSWYELFPRSEGAAPDADGVLRSGTFRTAAQRLDAVAAMGFDVVYLPPIHPIGEVNRKGPNNTLTPGPHDVGSPWAIGSKDGGHDAIHPDLGTLEDFDAFVARAGELGLEVALDLALQAAPDHPWVTSHPEFFTTRADGSVAYAENPPKKYQDIYPINFDNDPEGVRAEMLRVVRHWMDHGVRIFRVDNPHTKPLDFWEWLLGEVRRTDPDVLFLAEAFTRPAMMRALGSVGFHQSYTYFTWRTAKGEIEDYLRELSSETDHLMRPNFFVNTPDILHAYLQYGGPAAFKVRAALAATSSPTWGVYAGYELYEHVAVKPGSEEYLDSEKYQLRPRDWAAAEREDRTLAPYLTMLNEVRRRHPALQRLRNVTLHRSDDEQVLVYSKREGEDRVIVVLNLDPHGTRETTVHLDLAGLGLDWGESFVVHDEVTGQDWTWGEHDYVRLDPHHEPAHILSVRRTAP